MDLNRILQGLSSSGAVSGFAGGLAGSALVGAVSGKKGKKMAKGALKVGALAAVGGLAYTAYQRYQNNKPPGQPGGGAQAPAAQAQPWAQLTQDKFEAVVADDTQGGALLLIRAMIAAAHSDGHIDADEQDRVFAEAQRADLSAEEKAALFDELRNPLSISALVEQTANPETAVEVYAASVLAIDETRNEAKTYLRSLALALNLPAELTASVHAQVASAQQQTAA